MPQIEVTFDIDANGILNVTAGQGDRARAEITITASSGLNEAEIERMVKEAEKHASEDARRREQVELRNRADSMIFTAEKALRDYGAQVPESTKQDVEGKIEAVRKALEGSDTDAIKRTSDELGGDPADRRQHVPRRSPAWAASRPATMAPAPPMASRTTKM